MAILQRVHDGTFVSPGPRYVIGRSAHADWCLQSSVVSLEHAVIVWKPNHWYVRDLASTNGTWVNGQREPSGAKRRLRIGDEIAFGGAGADLRVVDDREPCPSAVASVGLRQFGQPRGLWLPDPEEPSACVTQEMHGWVFESESERLAVRHGDRVLVGNQSYRLELPPATYQELPTTEIVADGAEWLRLRFTVSTDEEHVSLDVLHRRAVIEMGARAHNYPLLLLARAKEAEREHLSPEQAGWVGADQMLQCPLCQRT